MIGVILVVDDEPTVAIALRRALIAAGHQVFAVHGALEALEVVAREPIDLVITDKDMPQMSGHALIDVLHERYPDVPCVMLTGAPTLESALAAVNAEQVIRYLTKPWSLAELTATVAAGLARRAELVRVSAERRGERERATLAAALCSRDPGLGHIGPGTIALVPTAVGAALGAAVSRLQDDPTTELGPCGIAAVLELAAPIEIALGLAMLPMRSAAVGVLVTAAGAMSRVEVDLGGRNHVLATLPRLTGELIAARLAAHAGIELITASERLGRLAVEVAGVIGQAVIAYRHTRDGATLEMRRVVIGDGPEPSRPPDHIDRYRLEGVIGEGGMGKVYRAVHRTIERTVAIKVLRGAYAHDPITIARFVREARAAVRARHPRIVETFDFGQLPDGRPYLVMELVEAETLRTRIKRGPLLPIDALTIAHGVAEGLAAAHLVDVIHRDLKPANVFVGEELDTKLADFGAAKILDDASDAITGEGTTLGTPYYMSPEHIAGDEVDGRSDLYALGCVLFEMIEGRPPFGGTSARAVLAQHLHAAVPGFDTRTPVSPSVAKVVRTAMAKDPRQRYQSALQMIGDLEIAATRQAAGR